MMNRRERRRVWAGVTGGPRRSGSPRTVSRVLGRVRGFSLVEIMIAMAVGLGLLGAVTALFGATSQARTEMAKVGRMFENGRYAQDLLAEELHLAGFFGELPILATNATTPDPCATSEQSLGWSATGALPSVPMPLVGYREGDSMPWCLPDRKSGTDVLVIRRVSTTPVATSALVEGGVYLQTSRCAEDLPAFAFGSTAAQLSLLSTGCVSAAPAREVLVRMFYVSRCNDCARDIIPTLKRLEVIRGQRVVTPLVEGIEDLRIDYGFDLDNDGTADVFARTLSGVAGAADDSWVNVMAARIHLLVRTSELPAGHTDTATYAMGLSGVLGPFQDGWKRTAFAGTARLVNPAGRRE